MIRPVETTPLPETPIADASRRALEQIITEHPVSMLIIYEVHGVVGYAPIPCSESVKRGLVDMYLEEDCRECGE